MTESKIWVAVYRLLKLLHRLPYPICSPLVPEKTTSQIELVNFSVRSITPDESPMIFAGQSQPQLLRYLSRDCLLDRKDVRDFALILLTPKLRSCGGINQVHLNV